VIMIGCALVVLGDTARRWLAVRAGTASPVDELPGAPYDPHRPPERCC
jgi:hypothetical protein